MVIGIDASRAFGGEKTGTEVYSYQMIKNILALPEATDHEFVLYTRGEIVDDVPGGKNVKRVHLGWPWLWTQAGLAWRTWVDKLDVLWVPAHTLPVLRRPGLRTVVTIHGIEYEWLPAYENSLQRWYLPLSTKYAVWSASRVVAVSEFTASQLVDRLKARREKIVVIHEGWEEGLEVGGKTGVLEKYDLKGNKYVLFVGTVQPRKNLERLIEAFAGVAKRNKGIKLVIAGKWGWGYDPLVVAVDRLGLEERVIFTGYINNAERYLLLQNAALYIQPSITEGFGLPILEAMAAGIPVISSSGGALKEVVGEAGRLVDPFNIVQMEEALESLINNEGERKRLIELGKKRKNEFSWRKAAEKTWQVIVLEAKKTKS